MRISDWSSDVCSSDLIKGLAPECLFLLHASVLLCLGRRFTSRRAVGAGKRKGRPVDRARAALHDGSGISAQHLERPHRAAMEQADQRRSEEHTSELQSLMRISYAVFCLQKKLKKTTITSQLIYT